MARVLFVLLGLSVILWGIQYKLSLYRSPATRRANPVARLLSQKERDAAKVGESFSLPQKQPLFPALTLPAFSALPQWSWAQSSGLLRLPFMPAEHRNPALAVAFRRFSPRAPPAPV